MAFLGNLDFCLLQEPRPDRVFFGFWPGLCFVCAADFHCSVLIMPKATFALRNIVMKKVQVGLLCLVVSLIAGQAMAKDNGKEKKEKEHDRYEQKDKRPTASIPEPGSIALLGAGLLGLALARRSKKI